MIFVMVVVCSFAFCCVDVESERVMSVREVNPPKSICHQTQDKDLAINYLGQPLLGDTLECFDYDDKIYITRTETSGEKTLVAIAK